MAKTVIHDVRGLGQWTEEDKKRDGDLVICSATMEGKPIPGRRTLVHAGASILEWHGGMDPYNQMLEVAATTFVPATETEPAQTISGLMSPPRNLLVGYFDPDVHAWAIDLNIRRMTTKLATFWTQRFHWANGILLDYACDLAWLEGFEDIPWSYWEKYRQSLSGLTENIRVLRPDWVVVQQQWQFVPPVITHAAGLYHEVKPSQFQQSLERIARDVARFRTQTRKLDPEREHVEVIELREPHKFSAEYKAMLKAWVEAPTVHDDDGSVLEVLEPFYVSAGRDATAGQTL